MRILRLAAIGLTALWVAGCEEPLNVDNTNAAERQRALTRPTDVEALIGGSYRVVHSATLGGFTSINIQAMSMGLENQSNLSNNQMGPRAAIPRIPIDNSLGNAGNDGNQADWYTLYRGARQAAVGLSRVNDPAFTFFPTNAAQKARAQAMGHFVIGTALGNIALIYDQGPVISATDQTNTDPTYLTPLPTVPFDSLMRFALAELDSAMHYDTLAASTSGGFAASTFGALNWFGNPGLSMSRDSMVAWARGYKARFRAGVARDPTARAAVNWTAVINDATAFLALFPNGVVIQLLSSAGWDIGYITTIYQSNQGNWTMDWQFINGMADTTTAQPYLAWLNTANASKQPFLVVTNDKRFPAGATRAAQQATGQGPLPAGQYHRNRSAPDWVGDPYGNGFYDNTRWTNFNTSTRVGPFPIMPATEIRMLRAEGYIRQSNFAAASTDIDVTRNPNTNAPVGPMNITTATQLLGPDAIHCMPHAPLLTAAATGTLACGTIMEAMKWEKRMETQFTHPYAWFIDARGWGDLPIGTATMWPTPYAEVLTRRGTPNEVPWVLSYGGGGTATALTNTYGLGKP